VWVSHLSERIHCICTKSKPDIPWVIREVLQMSKVKMFSLPTICRVLNLNIHLALSMPKQQLNIPWVGEHMLQPVDHRKISHHKDENVSLFRPFSVLIASGILPLLSLSLIVLFVGIMLNLLTVIIMFVSTSIACWTLIFEFMFFFVLDTMVWASMNFFYTQCQWTNDLFFLVSATRQTIWFWQYLSYQF
jgi:hypothetical protein